MEIMAGRRKVKNVCKRVSNLFAQFDAVRKVPRLRSRT